MRYLWDAATAPVWSVLSAHLRLIDNVAGCRWVVSPSEAVWLGVKEVKWSPLPHKPLMFNSISVLLIDLTTSAFISLIRSLLIEICLQFQWGKPSFILFGQASGPPTASCTALCLHGFWLSLRRETTQPPSAICARARSPSQWKSVCWYSGSTSCVSGCARGLWFCHWKPLKSSWLSLLCTLQIFVSMDETLWAFSSPG